MVRILSRVLNYFRPKGLSYSFVPLYDDRLWPWLRCFLGVWAILAAAWGFTLVYESLSASHFSFPYSVGSVRFWWFYTPVFGFIMQLRYYNHSSDGFWSSGPSLFIYARGWVRDLLSRIWELHPSR